MTVSDKKWSWASLGILLSVYVYLVLKNYYLLPMWGDNLLYVDLVATPDKSPKVFFRYFNYYVAKIFFVGLSDILRIPLSVIKACAFFSLLNHVGIIGVSYLIVNRVANPMAAFVAAAIVSVCPIVLFESMLYTPDVSCVLYGLISIFFGLAYVYGSQYKRLEIALSGFFLVGAIYSKITGVCFVLPILGLAVHALKQDRKAISLLAEGVAVAYLFLAICDAVWVKDFLYHLSPDSYIDYLSQFKTNLNYYLQKSSTEWGETFFYRFAKEGFIHYLIFAAVYVVLMALPTEEGFRKQKKISCCLIVVSIVAIVLHEGFHIRDTLLDLKLRWMPAVIVPGVLAFCILLFPYYQQDSKRTLVSRVIHDGLVLSGGICLWTTQRNVSYYQELISSWQFWNSFLKTFSFWIFLFALGGMILFFRERRDNNWKKVYGFFGVVIVLWYCATWGHIFAKEEHIPLEKNLNRYIRDGRYLASIAPKMITLFMGDIEDASLAVRIMYRDNKFTKAEYDFLMAHRSVQDLKALLLKDDYHYILMKTVLASELLPVIESTYSVKLTLEETRLDFRIYSFEKG